MAFEWLTFRRYVAGATGMAGLLIALGIYTSASGSGLACAQQWPLCDGGVLPQSIPSFVEWFHRLWAMITGFVIFGGAIWAWRADLPRVTTGAAVVAAVLTPMQAVFGAVTVTLEGAIPGGYSAPVHAAHFLTGTTIFLALTYASLTSSERAVGTPTERVGTALRVAAVGAGVSLLVSRAIPVVGYGPWLQGGFYLAALTTLAALVAAVRWVGALGRPRLRAATALATLAHLGAMVLGRDLVYYTATVQNLNLALALTTAALVAGTLWSVETGRGRADRARAPTDD
ncbi:MAG: uncharacterized protein required for cytochrome oxidase assembly [halophilic archaeon J07HB67]|jgi:Uncharacterized protein required for cytochrome oxidase assembly|nr:MAG: uncharacterized protein required for cytochrome oxidase assembly [halophilic archaeon J07HB67]